MDLPAPDELTLPLPAASKAAGEDVGARLRVLSAGEFYAQLPAAVPRQGECYTALAPEGQRQIEVGWELWADQVLARALVVPGLGVEELWQLEADRGALVTGYFEAVGFFLPPGAPQHYPPAFQDLMRRLCRRTGRLPHELLALPVDVFNLAARMLVPEWFAPAAPEAAAPVYTNDPALLESSDG